MIQFDEQIFQLGWFNHQLDLLPSHWFVAGLMSCPMTAPCVSGWISWSSSDIPACEPGELRDGPDFLKLKMETCSVWKRDGSWKFLGGGFKDFLFSPLSGEDFQFDQYFSEGLKPPTSYHLSFVACSFFQIGGGVQWSRSSILEDFVEFCLPSTGWGGC